MPWWQIIAILIAVGVVVGLALGLLSASLGFPTEIAARMEARDRPFGQTARQRSGLLLSFRCLVRAT